MHDSESETFVLKTEPEKFSDKLKEIDVASTPKEIATDDVESDDYYSRVFAQTTRMVTNKIDKVAQDMFPVSWECLRT